MSLLISCLLLTATIPDASIDEARNFLESLVSSDKSKKCMNCPSVVPPITNNNLLVFMSFSIPLESWKDWSKELESKGGVFVLNGLPNNSFQLFAKKVIEFRRAGVNIPICIDPDAFEKYEINAVPAVVLLEGDKYDKLTGNVQLERTLRVFAEKGSAYKVASKLLDTL